VIYRQFDFTQQSKPDDLTASRISEIQKELNTTRAKMEALEKRLDETQAKLATLSSSRAKASGKH
jgi:chaperonin cofactor prefoldin